MALSAAGIVLATLLAYANSLDGSFLFDDVAITANPSLRDLSRLSDVLSPPADVGFRGRPLTNLTFALNYAAGGFELRGYHAVNLAIHLAAALTLFGLVRRTLRMARTAAGTVVEGQARGRDATGLAFAIALLWTLHPLATSAVTYLSQRTESLAALSTLLALYAFARGWKLLVVVSCLLGVLTKETAAMAPLLVLLYDRTFVGGSFRAALAGRRGFYLALAATWLPLGWTLRHLHGHSVGFGFGVSAVDYALTSCRAIVTYLRLAFWPAPLVFDYGREVLVSRFSAAVLPLVLVVVLLGLTFRALMRRPRLGFAAGAFFLLLAPTTSFLPVAVQPIAENRMYLPLAALIASTVLALHARLGARAIVGAVVIALAFGVMTHRRNRDYDNPIAMWSDTVAKQPGNARAHNNLGLALCAAENGRAAAKQFEAALAIEPNSAEAHNNLGLALAPEKGVEHFRAAVRLQPRFFAAWSNLANALAELGRRDEALAAFEKALQLEPESADLHYNLGNVFFQLGRFEEAVMQYRASLATDPNFAPGHGNLGIALLRLGRRDEARRAFEAALRVEPDYAPAKQALGEL